MQCFTKIHHIYNIGNVLYGEVTLTSTKSRQYIECPHEEVCLAEVLLLPCYCRGGAPELWNHIINLCDTLHPISRPMRSIQQLVVSSQRLYGGQGLSGGYDDVAGIFGLSLSDISKPLWVPVLGKCSHITKESRAICCVLTERKWSGFGTRFVAI